MTRDDLGIVATVVLVGAVLIIAVSYLAGCSASLPYGRPGLALHDYIEAHVND
jgi:hypothetical protein